MRADLQAVHPTGRRRAFELLSVACGRNSSHKRVLVIQNFWFHAKLRALCLNALSATSAPKAYGKAGDKDNRVARSTEETVRKAVLHRHIRTADEGKELYPLRIGMVL